MAAKEDTFVASVDEKTMKLTFVSSRAVSQREAREIVQRMAKEKPGSVFVDLRFGTPVKFTQVVTYQPQEVELFGSSKTDDVADDAGDASSKAHAASDSASANVASNAPKSVSSSPVEAHDDAFLQMAKDAPGVEAVTTELF